MTVSRQAGVFVRGLLAGLLQETDEGYRFIYDSAYLNDLNACAVSLTLPLRPEPYTSSYTVPLL